MTVFRAILTTYLLCLLALQIHAQAGAMPDRPQDVTRYRFHIFLQDKSDEIRVSADIQMRLKQPTNKVVFDLVNKTVDSPTGMTVSNTYKNGKPITFSQENELLIVDLPYVHPAGDTLTINVQYQGTPADGLVIAQNKFGRKTFFGDNWPNRAHHWLSVVDHPADKAAIEFLVNSPDQYQVVANGRLVEETNLPENRRLTHWREDRPLPTKVMVIGVAPFAVQHLGDIAGTPVSSWVFSENRTEGFSDYAVAEKVLKYFVDKLGPFPYQKLANVQSKTRYGGMENAGAIFYFENSVNDQQDQEDLFAHEIAHQWFGNQASEADWHHIWLSEGFATYLSNLYWEDTYGETARAERMAKERKRVIDFAHRYPAPVVNTSVTDLNKLLNPNSYQKGSWVLHMLRKEIGDDAFWTGLKSYFKDFDGKNALTEDFQKVMEKTSGVKLDRFFKQWIYRPGHPVLSAKVNSRRLSLQQHQKTPFAGQLTVKVVGSDGVDISTYKLTGESAVQEFNLPKGIGKVKQIVIDPHTDFLWEKAN